MIIEMAPPVLSDWRLCVGFYQRSNFMGVREIADEAEAVLLGRDLLKKRLQKR